MTVSDDAKSESRPFEADVAKLLHMMVHSVYSEKEVFLRELISNAADACERLRYEAIANPALLGADPSPRITISIDADKRQLTLEDNGIGMKGNVLDIAGCVARRAGARHPRAAPSDGRCRRLYAALRARAHHQDPVRARARADLDCREAWCRARSDRRRRRALDQAKVRD